MVRTPPGGLLYPALGGAAAWIVFDTCSRAADVNPITATVFGAATAALLAEAVAGRQGCSALPFTTGGSGRCCRAPCLYTGVLSLGKVWGS